MGHNRLGRLPRTRTWQEVLDLFDLEGYQTIAVAGATTRAADNRLRQLANDPALGYCFWLLTRITWAARGTSFPNELARLGIDVTSDSSSLNLISQVAERVRSELSNLPPSGHFGDIGSLALRTALTQTVGGEGPSLFDSTAQDAQRAFRTYSTQVRFGELARRFFADFMSRTLRSFVDRELANHIGPGHTVSTINESLEFMRSLDTHTWQAARIVEEFAGDWYSKHNWESQGEISRDEAQRFVAQGLRKLRSELKRREGIA